MNQISTHVLDTSRGKPAAEVPLRLERCDPAGNWEIVTRARTDADGRCKQLLSETQPLLPGLYRIHFDTHSYFAAQGVAGLYPYVEITFDVRSGEAHFHIPLLLSPNG